jgi:hypothetical protein
MTEQAIKPARTLPYANERWFQLLQQAVAESSTAAVARRLSAGYARPYGRPAISQVMNGIYAGKTDKIAARVLEVLDRWSCPYLNTEISAEDCRAVHGGETPSHDPARLAQRRVCRTCKHNNTGGSK